MQHGILQGYFVKYGHLYSLLKERKLSFLREGNQLSLGFKDTEGGKEMEKEESWREEVEDAHEQNIVCK